MYVSLRADIYVLETETNAEDPQLAALSTY